MNEQLETIKKNSMKADVKMQHNELVTLLSKQLQSDNHAAAYTTALYLSESIRNIVPVPAQQVLEFSTFIAKDIYKVFFETATHASLIVDDKFFIHYANDTFGKLTNQAEFIFSTPVNFIDYLIEKDKIRAREYFEKAFDCGKIDATSLQICMQLSKQELHFDVFVNFLKEDNSLLLSLHDITQFKINENELTHQYKFINTLINTLPNPFYYQDKEGNFLGCNTAFEEAIGVNNHDIVGKSPLDIFPPEFADFHKKLDSDIVSSKDVVHFETSLLFAEGHKHNLLFYKSTFDSVAGDTAGIVGIMFDITDRKIAEDNLREAVEELNKISRTDPLTGLSNRRDMSYLLEIEKHRSDRSQTPFSFIMADIDNFKLINDNYGHACGDYILMEVANLIRETIRKQDHLARWGGEEFLLLTQDTNVYGAVILAEKLRKIIEEHVFNYNNIKIKITLTFGVSRYLPDKDIDACINEADLALYAGKKKGRNVVEFYQEQYV